MAQSLAKHGVEVHIATTDDDGPDRRRPVPLAQPLAQEDGTTIRYFPRQTRFYTFSWPLTRWLARHVRDYDIVHIHALFSYAAIPASWAAARRGVPYVVRPLGTLNRWGMRQRRPVLKQLSFRLVERRILEGAAAIHYTSEQERLEARELGIYSPAAVIPLGVDLDDVAQTAMPDGFLRARPSLAGRTLVLFLSRLDPKKGLDILLPAFSRVRRTHPEAALVLAGDGEETFVASLRDAVHSLGIDDGVVFTGFLEGEQKLSALAAASVFVLPSHSENFGMAPVEAMAAGLVVVVSEQVGISTEVRRSEAGLVVPGEVEAVADALERLVCDRELRSRLGENGRRLVRARFTPEATARELVALYERVIERRTRRVA
jgi:glycosyltransferase involved in cell wall biosynthesis